MEDTARQIGELRLRLERIEELLGKDRRALDDDDRPHLTRVQEVLEANPGEWLSASEIARRANLEPSSVRVILYGHKDDVFTFVRVTPGRVRWQLRPTTHKESFSQPSPMLVLAQA
jgi:hypothetical protein